MPLIRAKTRMLLGRVKLAVITEAPATRLDWQSSRRLVGQARPQQKLEDLILGEVRTLLLTRTTIMMVVGISPQAQGTTSTVA